MKVLHRKLGIQQPATVCLGHKSMCGFTIYRMDGRSDSGGTKWFVVVACATDIPAFFHKMFKTAFAKFFEHMQFCFVFSIVGLPYLPHLCGLKFSNKYAEISMKKCQIL